MSCQSSLDAYCGEIIPPPLRGNVIDELHSGHYGMVRMREIA